MSSTNLAENLSHFFGSDTFHRWSDLYDHIMTDGVKYLADEARAYWLLDTIASYLPEWPTQDFVTATLDVDLTAKTATLTFTDGNENRLGFQKIHHTDFPLETITLWAVRNELAAYTLLLPREY